MKKNLNDMAVARDAIALALMSEEQFSEVYAELENLPLLLETPDDLYRILRERSLLDPEDTAPGDFLIYVVSELADRGDTSVARLFERLVGIVQELAGQVEGGETVRGVLVERIDRLSKLRNVILSVKASFLVSERERLFISSKVVCDARPIFDEGLASFVMVNTLILDCQHGDEKSSIHVAIDADDIDNLIAQLERAKRKAVLTKAALVSSNVSVVE